ncbi:MAG: hypothetical protein J2P37_13350 [Ktedonobacteraceae bacterium]|nr:hypothetical protein [Ktedonobacteraceae bacterium]MBO0793817.1 hypothetical protein [Ktedonobacteraceae bacterium]
MFVRPLSWTRIWAWIFIGMSLAILAVVSPQESRFAVLAIDYRTQESSLGFPFWVTAISLLIAGAGLLAQSDRHPSAQKSAVAQQHLSRRKLVLNLAGMVGLAGVGASLGSWLVIRSLKAHANRIASTLPKYDDAVDSYALSWSAQNRLVLAQYHDGDNLTIREIAPGSRVINTSGPDELYISVAFSSNGRYLAVSSASSSPQLTSRILDLQTGTSRPSPLYYRAMAWSSDNSRLAGYSLDSAGGIAIWDVAQNRQLARYQIAENALVIRQIAWSPDDRWLAITVGPDAPTTIHFYEAQTGKNVSIQTFDQIQKIHGDLTGMAWSPDSRYIALAFATTEPVGQEQEIITPYPVVIWDVAAQKSIFSYTGHLGGVNCVAWSPDGTHLASGGLNDLTVQIWNATTGEQAFVFRGHKDSVGYVGWSPDGKSIASAETPVFSDGGGRILTWDAPAL